jgi:hypothetical protein
MASETAAISEPALAVLTKASKGWVPPFSLMVMKALPQESDVEMACQRRTRLLWFISGWGHAFERQRHAGRGAFYPWLWFQHNDIA